MTLKTVALFILAGICEIGGGFLVWRWLRDEKSIWFGIAGSFLLVLYGVLAAFQPTNFTKTYVIYGGIFILISMVWGYLFDNFKPDSYDVLGSIILIIGISIIYFIPR